MAEDKIKRIINEFLDLVRIYENAYKDWAKTIPTDEYGFHRLAGIPHASKELQFAKDQAKKYLQGLSDDVAKNIETAMYIGRSLCEGEDEWTDKEIENLKFTGWKYNLCDEYCREQIMSKRPDALIKYLTAYLNARYGVTNEKFI